MDAKAVRIVYAAGSGWRAGVTRVEVDGLDVASAALGADLRFRSGQTPRLVLDLSVDDVEVEGEMVVSVPEGTAAALVRLGWAPPPEKPR